VNDLGKAEVAHDMLQRTSRVLRRLVKMQDAGETSGEQYEKLVRKATRATKQSAVLLEQMSARGEGGEGG